PYDNVLIFQQPDFNFQRTVVLLGEVRYPGTYSLRTKGDRLAELITRAGGLTPRAYAQGIRFYRATGTAGRLDIDLARALADSGARDNVVLQPDDSIVIPEFLPSVKVIGAVNSPGSVLWRKGAGLEYYLNSAGGFAPNADKGTVSVRYANGRVRTRVRALLVHSDPKPEPGSEVFVPMKPPGPRTEALPDCDRFAPPGWVDRGHRLLHPSAYLHRDDDLRPRGSNSGAASFRSRSSRRPGRDRHRHGGNSITQILCRAPQES